MERLLSGFPAFPSPHLTLEELTRLLPQGPSALMYSQHSLPLTAVEGNQATRWGVQPYLIPRPADLSLRRVILLSPDAETTASAWPNAKVWVTGRKREPGRPRSPPPAAP